MLQMFDKKKIKYRCVKAFLDAQMEVVENQTLEEDDIKLVVVEDRKAVEDKMKIIRNIFKETGCTFEIVKTLAASCPYHSHYYNQIGKIVNKHFSVGDEYIPAFLTLEVLSIYKMQGYKDFEDIDILEIQAEFEAFKRGDEEETKEHRALIAKHFKCASDIVNHLNKYRIGKMNKKTSNKTSSTRKK